MVEVVHVIDADLARGAQRAGQLLVNALGDADTAAHRLCTIFESPQVALDPDITLAASSRGRRHGLAPDAVLRTRRAAEISGADLVIAHGGEALKYVSLARVDAPVVYHKIGSLGRRWARPTNAALHRWCVSQATAVVAISDALAVEATTELRVHPDNVFVIPNTRDPAIFRPAVTAVDEAQILWAGSFSETKRPGRFLDVVDRLHPPSAFRASMLGGGPMLESVRARTSTVSVRGPVDDMASAMAGASIFAFTSVPEGEGMPGVLIEAAMSGLPIVTTDVPGARDVVEDGVTGHVVDPDDVDAFVTALQILLDDPVRARSMGAAGRRRAVDRFSLETVTASWLDVVTSLRLPDRREVSCASST